MNIRHQLIALLILTFLFSSCGKKNRNQQGSDSHTSALSVDWEGTYAGIIPAADCPGIYRMVALDSNHFETLDKYLEREGIFISKGTFRIINDTLIVDGVAYHIGENLLTNSTDTLFRINEKKQLPVTLTEQVLVESVKGEAGTILRIYGESEKKMAELQFKGKTYLLSLNIENTQVNEYTDGENSLQMEVIDPAPEVPTIPVFTVGNKTHEFTIVSPSNYLFTSFEDSVCDVTYFNGEENYVLLLSAHKFYLLPQTEVWSKGSVYSNGEVSWTATGGKGVLKTEEGKVIEYVGQEITKK